MKNLSLWQQFIYYYQHNGMYVLGKFNQHFLISVEGVLLAAIVGIPIGAYIAYHRRMATLIIQLANLIQTIPSLAMVSILMLALGLGDQTVITTIFLYSLLPIIQNTYIGLQSVNPAVIDVSKGMGMTRFQQFYMIQLPLSISVVMAGIRLALVIAIGITAIGTFVGAGGLGDIIIRGTNATNGGAIILAGAVPTALMAIACDLLLEGVQKLLQPKMSSK